MSAPALNTPDKPVTDATLTIRVIKSFPYRTSKNVILHHLDLTTLTVGELKERVVKDVLANGGFRPYYAIAPKLDTMRLYTKAHGTKTMNLIINMEESRDENQEMMFLDEQRTLASYGCEHETEISFFRNEDYEAYKKNPEEKW
ncbi:hypothetical protein DFH27DRAFT_590713 [Peziza echinospora]|nr:hypothetical protein DFH27DRAFT_590713 [Peziza echinospora]